MGDFSNYEKQGPRSGHTVPFEVTELVNADGTHPIVHVEHFGRTNHTLMEQTIADAGKPTDAANTEALSRERIARHCARRLERVFFSDGTPATDADAPAFVKAMPLKAFERLAKFVMSEDPFVELPIAADPSALAEK